VDDRRLRLAEMVLTEIPGDDFGEMALRDIAEAVQELCFSPRDRDVIERYLGARRAHLDALKSLFPPPDETD
jgi:CHAD domain-containing protein